MAEGGGVNLVCGYHMGSAWGTAVALGANDAIRVTDLKWKDNSEKIPDMSYNNAASRRASDLVGLYRGSLDIDFDLKFQGCDPLIATFFGTAGTPVQIGSTGFYTHTWYEKNDMSAAFGTFGWTEGIVTHEADSIRWTKLTMDLMPGKAIKCKMHGEWRKRTENSATNANLNSLSEPSNINRVQYATSSIVTYSAVPFASSLANLEQSKITLNFERAYDDGDDEAFTSLSVPYRRLTRAKEFKATAQIQLPYTATTVLNLPITGALWKAKWAHALVAAQKEFNFWAAAMECTSSSADLKDKGGIPLVANFDIVQAVSTPSTFPATTAAITVVNARATDAMAA